MFYSAQILSRKGPLGTCWLASWSQRGLKRNEVFNCSLPAAVDSIINPEAPLALRLSGQLLLGLVRLYLRRLQFLEEDAGLALRGLARNAAAAGQHQVDLPDGGVAPEMAITLQDGGYDPMAQFVGNELFPSFESSLFGEGDLGGGHGGGGASLTVAQDISELFGSRWGGPEGEERFEVDGDAMERRFSTELERLRSQGVEAPRDRADMFFGGGAEEAFSPVVAIEDEIMAVPPEDMFAGPAPTPRRTSGKTPLSGAAPLPGLSDIRITPPSLPGGADLLPDIEAGGTSGGTAGGDAAFSVGAFEERGGAPVLLPMAMEEAADEAADAAAAAAGADEAATAQLQHAAARRRAVAAGPRRRRPTMDTGRDGRPATTLPSDEIRRLLADRKPLMTRRGLPSRRRGAPAPPGPFDVLAQSEAARGSELLRPASFTVLCPELLEMFGRALALPAGGAADGTPGAARRRRSSRGTVAADDEAAAAAVAAAEVAAEGELPPLQREEPPMSAGFTAGGAPSEFGAFSVGGFSGGGGGFEPEPEDAIEPADTQAEQQATAAGLFAAAGEGEEEPGLGERRGRVPLQPVPYSGELPAELGSIGPDSTSAAATSGSSGAAAQHATAFTRNTALVLEHLRREFAPSAGSKRRHPGSHGDLAAGMAALSLNSLLLGGAAPRGRLDAARWFYECLVLRNTGFVQLEQGEPYGDIAVAPTQLLTGGGGAGGGTPAGGVPQAP